MSVESNNKQSIRCKHEAFGVEKGFLFVISSNDRNAFDCGSILEENTLVVEERRASLGFTIMTLTVLSLSSNTYITGLYCILGFGSTHHFATSLAPMLLLTAFLFPCTSLEFSIMLIGIVHECKIIDRSGGVQRERCSAVWA